MRILTSAATVSDRLRASRQTVSTAGYPGGPFRVRFLTEKQLDATGDVVVTWREVYGGDDAAGEAADQSRLALRVVRADPRALALDP